MTRSVKIGVIVLVVAALATIGLIVLGVQQSMGQECEVCITFNGATACRSAKGATEGDAIMTATSNACAFLAAGMTASVQCQNRVPDKAVCE